MVWCHIKTFRSVCCNQKLATQSTELANFANSLFLGTSTHKPGSSRAQWNQRSFPNEYHKRTFQYVMLFVCLPGQQLQSFQLHVVNLIVGSAMVHYFVTFGRSGRLSSKYRQHMIIHHTSEDLYDTLSDIQDSPNAGDRSHRCQGLRTFTTAFQP